MSAPDVIFVGQNGDLYDATAAGWNPRRDVHPLAGVCGPALQAPQHAVGCWVEGWPSLASICTCRDS